MHLSSNDLICRDAALMPLRNIDGSWCPYAGSADRPKNSDHSPGYCWVPRFGQQTAHAPSLLSEALDCESVGRQASLLQPYWCDDMYRDMMHA